MNASLAEIEAEMSKLVRHVYLDSVNFYVIVFLLCRLSLLMLIKKKKIKHCVKLIKNTE